MKKNKKLLTALVLALIFSFSLMPMAFADAEAAPVETAAEAPVAEAAPAETVTESSSDNYQEDPVAESATPEAAEESEAAETTPEAEEVTETSETVETAEVTDANEESEATETAPAAEAAEESEESETKETTGASTYTVEFVNPEDGSEVKIVGGSDIYFTVLNQELGLGIDIDDVASIESSNNELFTAEKVDGDYVIHTFQPFSSAEQLLISLVNSGVVSVDVFDADYSSDEGFKAIAESFVMDVDGTWSVPTKDSAIKIQYLGKTWYVIGFNGTGIKAGADQMMLLLDDVPSGETLRYSSWNDDYATSELKTAMEEYLTTITEGQDEELLALLTEMTLAGGQGYSSSKPYCDGVSGDSVTSKIRPLTTQEAMILSNFNQNQSDSVLRTSGGYYWLASPCYSWDYNYEVVADVRSWGEVIYTGDLVNRDTVNGMRPVLMLNLTDDIITSKISDGVYELKFADDLGTGSAPSTGADTVAAYVRVLVYVDGKLINEGTDYTWSNGKVVLTEEFVKTLSAGSHKITVVYTGAYGDTLPSDFEYTATNSNDFTVNSKGYTPETDANLLK